MRNRFQIARDKRIARRAGLLAAHETNSDEAWEVTEPEQHVFCHIVDQLGLIVSAICTLAESIESK